MRIDIERGGFSQQRKHESTPRRGHVVSAACIQRRIALLCIHPTQPHTHTHTHTRLCVRDGNVMDHADTHNAAAVHSLLPSYTHKYRRKYIVWAPGRARCPRARPQRRRHLIHTSPSSSSSIDGFLKLSQLPRSGCHTETISDGQTKNILTRAEQQHNLSLIHI